MSSSVGLESRGLDQDLAFDYPPSSLPAEAETCMGLSGQHVGWHACLQHVLHAAAVAADSAWDIKSLLCWRCQGFPA